MRNFPTRKRSKIVGACGCIIFAGEYKEVLVAHHKVMAAAVKTKQVVDEAACDALDTAIAGLAPIYKK